MAAIYKGTLGLIGNTPLVEPVNLEKELGLEATILVKLEYLPERRFCYHRTYFRKHRNRTCINRSSEGVQSNSYHARDHEC